MVGITGAAPSSSEDSSSGELSRDAESSSDVSADMPSKNRLNTW